MKRFDVGLLELLLYIYTTPVPHEESDHPSIIHNTNALLEIKAIEPDAETASLYRTTPLGRAWVEMICATPMPVLRYVDPRDETVIQGRF